MSTSTAVAERPQTGTAVANAKPADAVRAALEKMKPQIALALPRHLTADRLLRVAMTAVQNTPKLLECDRTSLYAAIMTCAQLGLEPDGVLGQAYLVPFAGKVQFIPGYKGLISLARNSGDVSSIEAHEVRDRDQFDFAFGLNARCEHVPARGDRGEIRYFYAIARFKDGGHHWDVMTREEVETIRNRSSGWQSAVKFKKEDRSPWSTDFAEMGKKTVIRRIAKYLPMSVQKAAAIADAYDAGRHGTIDVHGELVIEPANEGSTDEPRQIERKESRLERFENDDAGDPPHDAETGEIHADQNSPAAGGNTADAPSSERAPAPGKTHAAAPADGTDPGTRPTASVPQERQQRTAADEAFFDGSDYEVPVPGAAANRPDWKAWGDALIDKIAIAAAGELGVLRSHNANPRTRCLGAAGVSPQIVADIDRAYTAAEKRTGG